MIKKSNFGEIREYLIKNANSIQRRATQHHKELLGGNHFRSEVIEKYQELHIEVVNQLALHLDSSELKKGRRVFKELGEKLAKDSVKDRLTIEEATDGIIFLKQTMWEKLAEGDFLKKLTNEEYYEITQMTGTLVDIVVSKIAFTYHNYYSSVNEQQQRLKNEFIGMASHELKTPVTSIKAFAQVLQSRFAKAGDLESAQLLLKMDGQLEKLTSLIGDLLDVTKLETGKLQFHRKFFDLKDLVSEIVEEMQRTTERHKIQIKLGSPVNLYGDRDRIGQTLTNLLTNAIKYSPKANKIVVSTKADKKEATVCIQDFGVGIPKEAQGKVFDQFYRVAGRNEETYSGMGLGLYVSKEIINRHNGRIWLESEKGKGSKFYFALPISKNNHN